MPPPSERRRNLIWDRDALEELSCDAGLLAKWGGEAAELLGLYPSTDFLSRRDAGDLVQLQAFADVLNRARSLFEKVRVGETCSAQLSSAPTAPARPAQALLLTSAWLQQAGQLVALYALIKLLDEGL